MHRLDRRKIILEGKRKGAFDPNQYFFERSSRTRLNRKVRVLLRQGLPAVLLTPRWSSPGTFLEDLSVDLALGEPSIKARPLGLSSLKGLTVHQAWAWLASAVAEFCQVSIMDNDGSGRPLWQAVSRHGFREVLADLLRRAEGGRRRCLMFHSLEHAHVEAVQDLFEVFAEHRDHTGPERVVNFLFAGAIDAPYLELAGAPRLVLGDYASDEAIAVLVEHLGPLPQSRLKHVVAAVGGVPALIETLARHDAEALPEILMDRKALWSRLGSVGDEIRSSIDILSADPDLSARLERLARLGAMPTQPLDDRLVLAGLVRRDGTLSEIRSPWFADVVLSS